MKVDIRYGANDDYEWLCENDTYVSSSWVRRCLDHDEYIIAEEEAGILGFIRYSMFWGQIPYMDLIRVLPSMRRKGIGSAMVKFWENEMRKKSAKILMTSSMENEPEPQNWHKRNGFFETGKIGFGILEPVPEVFFVKNLVSA